MVWGEKRVFFSVSSSSCRPGCGFLRSTSHLCFAQQSLAICQQRYLPYAGAEDCCGKLVSTGKLMADVSWPKHSEKRERDTQRMKKHLKKKNVFSPFCFDLVWTISSAVWPGKAAIQEIFKVTFFLFFYLVFICCSLCCFKCDSSLTVSTDSNPESPTVNQWCQSCLWKALQLVQEVDK